MGDVCHPPQQVNDTQVVDTPPQTTLKDNEEGEIQQDGGERVHEEEGPKKAKKKRSKALLNMRKKYRDQNSTVAGIEGSGHELGGGMTTALEGVTLRKHSGGEHDIM